MFYMNKLKNGKRNINFSYYFEYNFYYFSATTFNFLTYTCHAFQPVENQNDTLDKTNFFKKISSLYL